MDQVGFAIYPAPQGFDHMALTTVVDQEGRVYRQIYGGVFEAPAVVEPLKELVFGRRSDWTSLEGLANRVRLFCTLYDPRTGAYRFDFGPFIGHGDRARRARCRRGVRAARMAPGRALTSPRPMLLSGRRCSRVLRPLRLLFERLESLLDRAFPPAWQPLYHLGALGFFFYWIVAISGIYLYIFFDTGIAAAYGSVE